MKETMCGVIFENPELGARYRTDLPVPVPGAKDVLVRVKATAICGTDQHIYAWTQWAQDRIPIPMVFGHEFSGDIVAVGCDVKDYKVGDRVAGETHIPCNQCYMCNSDRRHNCVNMKIIGVHVPGSFAEYIAFPQDCVYKLDDSLSYRDACMLEPMGVAVHGVSAAGVKGNTVVVYGSGPIGLMAVGAAKVYGAKKIINIDIYDEKLAIAKKMGADVTVNSKQQDPVSTVFSETGNEGADIVIDYTGNEQAVRTGFSILRKNGKFVMVGLPSKKITLDWTDAIIYKEATVLGVTGRLMYQTWKECSDTLNDPDFSLHPVIGGVYQLKDFKRAFEDIRAGAPGKMILLPE